MKGEKNEVLAVVGNNCHLYENDNLANEEQAKDFAKKINAIFMLVSSKTGDGIEKLFKELIDRFFESDFTSKYQEMKRKKGNNLSLKNESDLNGNKKRKNTINKNSINFDNIYYFLINQDFNILN